MTTKGIEITLPTGTSKLPTDYKLKSLFLVAEGAMCDACSWNVSFYGLNESWLCPEHARELGLLW